jgi:hypothetical protein
MDTCIKYCDRCNLYKNDSFCANCGNCIEKDTVENVKKIIKKYLTKIPIFHSNGEYTDKVVKKGVNTKYTDEFIKTIKKLENIISTETYIIKIIDIIPKSLSYFSSNYDIMIDVEVYTKDEWSNENYPFLKYYDEWWKHIFYAKELNFTPLIENKFYMYFGNTDHIYIKKLVKDLDYDRQCRTKATKIWQIKTNPDYILGYDASNLGPIKRENLDILVASFIGVNINDVYEDKIKQQ